MPWRNWMIFRILPQKLAWSCETNMFSAIDQATRLTTRAGASLRSNCGRPRGFRRSACTPRPGITPPATEFFRRLVPALRLLFLLLCTASVLGSAAFAQLPAPTQAPPPPPGQDPNAGRQGSKITLNVDLVVLHTTVIDDRQRFADGLKPENFRVFEDKVEQKLSVSKREDLPVSMRPAINNSDSIRDTRPRLT